MSTGQSPIPEGFHTVTPYLIVRNASKAIAFYRAAFDAEEVNRMLGPDGTIMHAQIKIGDSYVMLSDEFPDMDCLGPESRSGATGYLMLYVDNVDDAMDKAIKAGCSVKYPVSDMFWGDRYGKVLDPFGHFWGIASRIEEVTPQELKKRSQSFAKEMAGSTSN